MGGTLPLSRPLFPAILARWRFLPVIALSSPCVIWVGFTCTPAPTRQQDALHFYPLEAWPRPLMGNRREGAHLKLSSLGSEWPFCTALPRVPSSRHQASGVLVPVPFSL